jgi:hypothetical protein
MTNQQHPMVPPNILLNSWESDWFDERENVDVLLIQAYQAGADAELEACVQWLDFKHSASVARNLRDERRPKLLSLKEQALSDLKEIGSHYISPDSSERIVNIRRALETLSDD